MQLKGANVLVTGAGGFIGSHLVERLRAEGADVYALLRYSSQGRRGWLDNISAHCALEFGDIRDQGQMRRICCGIDIIYHLAALISVPYSYEAVESYVQTNVMGTVNILEAAQYCKAKRVIVASTSEIYGTPATIPILETHPRKPQSPYAATKVAADALCHAYWATYDLPVVVIRAFNTYGPRQSTRAVIPHILLSLKNQLGSVPLGNPDSRRDFTHVDDIVDGYIRAGTAPDIEGDEIQLGTGETISIKDLLTLCNRIEGTDAQYRQTPQRMRPATSEVMVLCADANKARKKLGWSPTIGLEDGIRRTSQWFSRNIQHYSGVYYA